ncbi:MAG: hypothetical protein PHT07_21655 [Paludibacter sp.]|nr:hypothetical protein [Paludibacter sp.]
METITVGCHVIRVSNDYTNGRRGQVIEIKEARARVKWELGSGKILRTWVRFKELKVVKGLFFMSEHAAMGIPIPMRKFPTLKITGFSTVLPDPDEPCDPDEGHSEYLKDSGQLKSFDIE